VAGAFGALYGMSFGAFGFAIVFRREASPSVGAAIFGIFMPAPSAGCRRRAVSRSRARRSIT
jgi:hypothetical protein